MQAVDNNFVPLLFLTFQSQYGIPLSQVTLLITINFALQLAVDGVFGVLHRPHRLPRRSSNRAHLRRAGSCRPCFSAGSSALAVCGLLLSVLLYALGGGLLEVIISPIVESCPSDHKAQTMSLLHSFYCWGSAGVIVISTLFLKIFGVSSWKILAAIWALLPAGQLLHVYQSARLRRWSPRQDRHAHRSALPQQSLLGYYADDALCRCERAGGQPVGLYLCRKRSGRFKAVGDLAGPTVFALLMATSRLLYSKFGAKIDLNKAMMASALLCVVFPICSSA